MAKMLFAEWEIPQPPTRRQTTENYIGGFSERDTVAARAITDQLFDEARPLARCQVLVPVAAHQEAAQIENAIAEYAGQQTDEPFSVILGLNSPLDEQDNLGIADTLAQIEKAKQAHPDLDLRTAMTFYEQPTIGMIRRDLWNGALLTSMQDGSLDDSNTDIVGINHDIDIVSVSPHYVQRVQQFYDRKQRFYAVNGLGTTASLPSMSTFVKHAPSPDHPNISKGMFWTDFTTRAGNGSYEAGLIIPFSHYTHAGGFSVDAKTYETGPLVEDRLQRHTIPGASLQTSPRRYIDRLRYGYDAIWTNDSFGPSDECRQDDAEQPDITFKELELAMLKDGHLKTTINNMAHGAINLHLAKQTATNEMLPEDDVDNLATELYHINDQQSALAVAMLSRVIQSTRLTDEAINLYYDKERRKEVVFKHFSFPE